MSKPVTARYRTTNWSIYTASLRERGSLLIWLDKEMTWLAPHDGPPQSSRVVLGRGDPVMFDHQGPVQAAAPANDRDGCQPAEAGGPGLGGAGLHDPMPSAEEANRSDSVSARRWPPDPAGGQHRHQVSRRWRVAGAKERYSRP